MFALGHCCGGLEEHGVGILAHPGSRGGSFSPQNGHVLLSPMLRQGEGWQGEAKCLCRDTSGVTQPCVEQSVMLWMLVAWDSPFQTGTPCFWQHCLCCMLPAKKLRLCPGSPLHSGPWPWEGCSCPPRHAFQNH